MMIAHDTTAHHTSLAETHKSQHLYKYLYEQIMSSADVNIRIENKARKQEEKKNRRIEFKERTKAVRWSNDVRGTSADLRSFPADGNLI